MQIQENPIEVAQQICMEANSTSIENPNQNIINQEKQAQVAQVCLPIPTSFQRQFIGGVCKLIRRKRSVKIQIHFNKVEQKSANSIEELFTKQFQAQDVTFYISNEYMSKEMKDLFKKAGYLYEFLFKFIGTDKVKIDREKMHLQISEDKQLVIIFAQEIELEKQRNKVVIEVERLQDKLYQFSNQQIQYLNSVSRLLQAHPQNINNQNNQVMNGEEQKSFGIDFDLSQDQFLQKQEINTQEQSEEQLRQILNRQEEKIKEFQQIYAEILNLASKNIVNSQPAISTKSNINFDETTIVQESLPKSHLFPPGYTPPHLAKRTDPDGFTSATGLKFQANQTKKEKLRMSKRMLKLGYSVEEIMQRLKDIAIAQKSGKIQNKNAYIAPTTGPVRAFHIPRQKSAPINFQNPRPAQVNKNGNEKIVREKLIALLRQKRYKKLDQIQRHMANEGIQTTIETLKGIIEEIRAKNAQKKSQNQ